jgi:LDH2 family malate/lactate/ureidoglycolate dehydrogenase
MAGGEVRRYDPQGLLEWTAAVFERRDCPPQDARLVADTLVEADLRGVYSHGVARVPIYVKRLELGACNPRPNVRVERETAATALVDGDHGLGQVVSQVAMRVTLDKAASAGTSYVAVRTSNHHGACAYWAMQALPRDMIGIASTVSGGNIMAPWGARQPLLGNNPIAYAVPAGQELPVVLDMATSVVAKGKIMVAAAEGRPIPADWALDPDGRPTTDAKAAMKGLVQPTGGAKGSGLSMVYGLLGAVLPAADFGSTVGDTYERPGERKSVGHYFQAIDVAAFRPVDEFKADVDRAIREIKALERAPEVEEIFIPGEPEFRRKERNLREGVELGPGIVAELDAVGRRLGMGTLDALART